MAPPGELRVVSDGAGGERAGRPGGWAFVVVKGDEVLAEGAGRAAKTTSVMMELTAALEGLRAVKAGGWAKTHRVVLVSDSRVALEAADRTFTPRPAAYRTVCERLQKLFAELDATTRWVRGHADARAAARSDDVKWNAHVDAWAGAARDGE